MSLTHEGIRGGGGGQAGGGVARTGNGTCRAAHLCCVGVARAGGPGGPAPCRNGTPLFPPAKDAAAEGTAPRHTGRPYCAAAGAAAALPPLS